MHFPAPNEYDPFYSRYVSYLKDLNSLSVMEDQYDSLPAFYQSIPAEKLSYRYAAGKWSIKEILGHLTDAERVFSYRLMRMSHGDQTPLAGFDENLYMESSDYDDWTLAELLENFQAVRKSTLTLVRKLPEAAFDRTGIANGVSISVRALAAIIPGHCMAHSDVIKERYL